MRNHDFLIGTQITQNLVWCSAMPGRFARAQRPAPVSMASRRGSREVPTGRKRGVHKFPGRAAEGRRIVLGPPGGGIGESRCGPRASVRLR